MPFNGSTWVPHAEFTNGTLVEMAAYSSTITDGVWGILILFGLYLVLLVASVKLVDNVDPIVANAGVMFTVTVVSFLMVPMEWIIVEVAWVMTFLTVGSVAILFLWSR